jgi:nucleoid-associated protein YgaU
MYYFKISVSMMIFCLVFYAGCIHAQHSVKKQVLIPVNLPGMGGVAAQEKQKPEVAAAGKESMPEKITVTPQEDNEIITREVFSVALSTMSTEAAVAMSKTAIEPTAAKPAKKQLVQSSTVPIGGKTPVKKKPSKINVPAYKNILKPQEEINQKAEISGQPPETSSVAAAEPAASKAEKALLLAPSLADIEELKKEEAQASPYVKPEKTTEAAAVPAKETAEENAVVEENRPEAKQQPAIEKTKPEPQVKIETKPDSMQEDRFAKEKPDVQPAEEVNLAKPAAKLTAQERQQAAKIKYKEEEMKKRQKQEGPKHPAKMHTVTAGDTLPLLSEKYYGDKNQWVKIYDANKDKIEKGSLKTYQLILIP